MRKEVSLEDGREVVIVGTSHVSGGSVEEVEQTLESEEPDLVSVELDPERLEALRGGGWEDMDVAEAMKSGKGPMLAFQLLAQIYQRRLGDSEPGKEMLTAVNYAEETSTDLLLADRPLSQTVAELKNLGLREKLRGLKLLLSSSDEDVDVENAESLIEELDAAPGVRRVLIDDRNQEMAERILGSDFDRAVAIVGAGHVSGLVDELRNPSAQRDTSSRGLDIPWLKAVKYGFPVLVTASLAYSLLFLETETLFRAGGAWIVLNGLSALAGSIAARAHWETHVVTALIAPLTSIDPAVGTGMVSSYVEATRHPPTVEEMEELTRIDSYRELWSNQFGRIILAFVLVTIGSGLATVIGSAYVASVIGL